MPLLQEELFVFFAELEANNTKEWFEANRDRYETFVRDPLLRFIEAFAEPLSRISRQFEAIAAVRGGSLFRIHRDTRFSKDKRPYKTAAGVQFRHRDGADAHAPGFYLHLGPGDIFAGVGLWGPDTQTLTKIRRRIVDEPERWMALTQEPAFAQRYDLARHGETLKTAPRGFDKNHPLVEDLKRKHFIAVASLTQAQVCRNDFARTLAGTYALGGPFMEFLTTAIGLEW